MNTEPGAGCIDVRARAQAKIEDIEQRVTHLVAMKRALHNLAEQCSGLGPTASCPILEALGEEGLWTAVRPAGSPPERA